MKRPPCIKDIAYMLYEKTVIECVSEVRKGTGRWWGMGIGVGADTRRLARGGAGHALSATHRAPHRAVVVVIVLVVAIVLVAVVLVIPVVVV